MKTTILEQLFHKTDKFCMSHKEETENSASLTRYRLKQGRGDLPCAELIVINRRVCWQIHILHRRLNSRCRFEKSLPLYPL